jgi:hypothetical protein
MGVKRSRANDSSQSAKAAKQQITGVLPDESSVSQANDHGGAALPEQMIEETAIVEEESEKDCIATKIQVPHPPFFLKTR